MFSSFLVSRGTDNNSLTDPKQPSNLRDMFLFAKKNEFHLPISTV